MHAQYQRFCCLLHFMVHSPNPKQIFGPFDNIQAPKIKSEDTDLKT